MSRSFADPTSAAVPIHATQNGNAFTRFRRRHLLVSTIINAVGTALPVVGFHNTTAASASASSNSSTRETTSSSSSN
ncbi:hypothetical protein CEP53_004925 [Fusarium sp. AF-6]|nr:hypothetical protein CEP53_004925 [Fusarium sp. AF-6]